MRKKKKKLSKEELQDFLDLWTIIGFSDVSNYMFEKWNEVAYEQISELIQKSGKGE